MKDLNHIVKGAIIQEDEFFPKDILCSYIKQVRQGILCKLEEGTMVAIALPRNVHLITTILACIEKGISFLPLDVWQPKERIEYMLSNASIDHVISSEEIAFDFGDRTRYNIEESMTACEEEGDQPYHNDTAYILYTSGTTGKPKAVEVKREGFFNFIDGVPQVIAFQPEKRIACFTSFTFDIFFLESVLPLYRGLTVVLATQDEENNAKKMADILVKQKVDMIQMTPSRVRMIQMVDRELTCMKGLETIMIGGEAFPQNLLSELQSKTNARIYNMYGPTETTIWSTICELTKKQSISIGSPIKDTRIYLLKEDLTEAKAGEVGEICIAGSGLAKGYVNDIAQTDLKFTALPFEPYERIYRTGDLGKYDEENNLLCLGRMDSQIKMMGHRIELEDIEANLMLAPEVKAAAACYVEEYEKIIVFYMAQKELDHTEMMTFLQSKLPRYMVPSKYILVNEFCYTTSGKLDRKRMVYQMQNEETAASNEIQTSNIMGNEMIQFIQQTLRDVMHEETIQLNYLTTLEELNINSFDFVNTIVAVEDEYDIEFEMEKLNNTSFTTIGELVTYIGELREG